MAKKKDDLELDVAAGGEAAGGSKKKLIVIVAAVLVVLLAGGGAAWFLLGHKGEDAAGKAESSDTDKGHKSAKSDKGHKEGGPALYLTLDPKLVVNFETPGKARFLQVGMDLMAHDQAVIDGLKQHMPAIRNELLLLFSGKSYETLASREGKEAIKTEILEAVNRILAAREIKGRVEEVYFTTLVMQ